MTVHLFHRAAIRPRPWKNGGGSTLEIACEPVGAGIDDFDWRVSIATVAANGPFSEFPGVDRSITLLRGAGMRLHSRETRVDHGLSQILKPFAFAGDRPLDATLLGGVSEDFNVMTRRGRWRADVRVMREAGELPACDRAVWFAANGAWRIHLRQDHCVRLDTDAGCWLDAPVAATRAEPVDVAPSALITVQLWSIA